MDPEELTTEWAPSCDVDSKEVSSGSAMGGSSGVIRPFTFPLALPLAMALVVILPFPFVVVETTVFSRRVNGTVGVADRPGIDPLPGREPMRGNAVAVGLRTRVGRRLGSPVPLPVEVVLRGVMGLPKRGEGDDGVVVVGAGGEVGRGATATTSSIDAPRGRGA